MRKVTCASCGRPYDYDSDDFCPKCGSYNPPPARAGARPAQAPPARVSAASKDRPRPAAQPKTPPVGPRTVSYGGPQGGTPWEEPPARRQRSPLKLLVLVLVSLFLLCIVLPFVLGLMLNLSEAFAGRRPEPGAVAQAEPAGGTHALWEPFSIHGTQQVTVEDPWEVDLTYVPLARREGFRCLAVDLWVVGGERRDDLTFFPAELRLEDGTAFLAEDDASLARQLKELEEELRKAENEAERIKEAEARLSKRVSELEKSLEEQRREREEICGAAANVHLYAQLGGEKAASRELKGILQVIAKESRKIAERMDA